MTLPELSVRRHVLALMISVIIILFGAIGLRDVGVDRVPNIDLPVINVSVSMSGADPEVIDTAITEVIERRVNRVPGVDSIQSVSSPGSSEINAVFSLDRDVDVAFNEVQAKVNEVIADLPDEADPPIVSKVSFESQPILWLALTGDRDLLDLSLQSLRVIRPQIENVPGVAEVVFGGGQGRNIRVEINPSRLAAQRVTVPELLDAIGREHVQMAGGFLVSGTQEDLIQLDLEYHNLQELAELIIVERDGSTVRLGDVAEVVDGLDDQRRIARFNGEQAVGLGVAKVAGTNTVAIAEDVKKRVAEEIVPQLPDGLSLSVAYDESRFINEQISSLRNTIGIGIVFAALVLWVFLKSYRSTAIVSLSIPVSLMAAVAVLYFFGYTLNSVTMLALLLLVGVVVDDAIVVLESIYRHRGSGDRRTAAIAGSNEVFFAVVASSLSLISIFASVIFLEAVIGRFFQSFAVVVTFGVLVSSVVALSLIPMLGSRFIATEDNEGRLARFLERGLAAIDNAYRRVLVCALGLRWITLALIVVVIAAMAFVAGDVDREFAPEEDTGQFTVNARAPLGSSLEYTSGRLSVIEHHLEGVEEIESIFSSIGASGAPTNEASIFVTLVDRGERDISQQDLMARLEEELADIPGTRNSVSSPGLLAGERGEPLQFVVGGLELERLDALAQELLGDIENVEGMGRVDLDLDLDLPQLALEVDRTRAARLGIPTDDLARTVNVLIGGTDAAHYNDEPGDGRRYNLRVKAQDGTFASGDDLRRIYLRSEGGDMVRLDGIADFKETTGPAAISRYDLRYAATFYAAPDMPMDEAVATVEEAADGVLPPGFNLEFIGEAEEMADTADSVVFILFLAVALVYIVLASQFNSFLQPFFVMLAQPLAFVGGFAGLWLGGFTLNIFSAIGLILLMGLVTKNGILLVDLTNQYRDKRGLGVNEALVEACPVRLRPILMTSLTLILAMIPALFGLGAGSESNAPMAAAIVGGMVVAMLLTLVMIPVVYSLVEGMFARRAARKEAAHSPSGG